MFGFSFAPFMAYGSQFVREISENVPGDFDGWYMAWSTQMFMAPITWFVILCAVAAAGLAVLRMATGREFTLLGFRDADLQVGFGLFAVCVLFGYAVSAKQFSFGLDDQMMRGDAPTDYTPDFSWGGILMLVGAVVAVFGAFLNHHRAGPSVSARLLQGMVASTAAPAGYQPPQQQQQPAYPQTGYVNPPPPPQQYAPAPHAQQPWPGHQTS